MEGPGDQRVRHREVGSIRAAKPGSAKRITVSLGAVSALCVITNWILNEYGYDIFQRIGAEFELVVLTAALAFLCGLAFAVMMCFRACRSRLGLVVFVIWLAAILPFTYRMMGFGPVEPEHKSPGG